MLRDLSEISRWGGGGNFKFGFGNYVTHPLELGIKYHDPPFRTELKEKCSKVFKVQYSKPTRKKKRKQKQNKRKAKKARAKD